MFYTYLYIIYTYITYMLYTYMRERENESWLIHLPMKIYTFKDKTEYGHMVHHGVDFFYWNEI